MSNNVFNVWKISLGSILLLLYYQALSNRIPWNTAVLKLFSPKHSLSLLRRNVRSKWYLHAFEVLSPYFVECQDYQNLTSSYRKTTHVTVDAANTYCDQSLGPGWFRFQGDAGTKMPTSCVSENHCGTNAAGWLNGAHPTVAEGQVSKQVCFTWLSNCCHFAINIQVRNCGFYFVYFISGTLPSNPCYLGYCGTD